MDIPSDMPDMPKRESDIVTISYEADEATFKDAIKNRKEKVKLLSIAATPFQSEQHFATTYYYKIKNIDFYNNCTETYTTQTGASKERAVRCATWLCIWKITDKLQLSYDYTETDKNIGLRVRTMYRISDDHILGYLWFDNAMRHSTILEQYKCDMATVMTGAWTHTLPPSMHAKKEENTTSKKKCGFFDDEAKRNVPARKQPRDGKGMHTQLVANEFYRGLLDQKDHRIMWYEECIGLFKLKTVRGPWFMHPDQPVVPLQPHPKWHYIVHPAAVALRRGQQATPDLSYMRPNAKRQRTI
jgi:hypothetical protein